jgi:hypothetical protein
MRPVAGSSLIGPIGPHRIWSWAAVRLTDVKEVRAGLGGTVNDVVLTLITNGFRELLQSRGEAVPEDLVIRTTVPVSVRRRGERGVYNNRVSAVFAGLPVGLPDPARRLESIRAEMDGVKSSKQAVAGDVLTSLSGFAPPLLLALGSRLVTLSPRLNMHTATTNVPGPQQPVQTLGRRMLESYPFVPVVGSIRIVVAIFSYDGGLYFGVTGDYDGAPDVDQLTAGIERGMGDLLALVAPRRPRARSRAPRGRRPEADRARPAKRTREAPHGVREPRRERAARLANLPGHDELRQRQRPLVGARRGRRRADRAGRRGGRDHVLRHRRHVLQGRQRGGDGASAGQAAHSATAGRASSRCRTTTT